MLKNKKKPMFMGAGEGFEFKTEIEL